MSDLYENGSSDESEDDDSICVPEPSIIKHKNGFLRNGFISITVIGKSGCGKTRLLCEILPWISDKIKTIIVATKLHDVPMHKAICDYFKKRGAFTGIVYTPADLNEFVEKCLKYKHVTPEKQALIIFDDFNEGSSSPLNAYWKAIIDCVTKGRNNGFNFITLAQQPTFIPPIVRNNTTARIFFDCYSKSAIQTFAKDLTDRVPCRGVLDTLFQYITTIPFTYIYTREHPFDVSAGKLGNIKTVISEKDVIIPTLRELEKEMGVTTSRGLNMKTAMMQGKAGNTAPELGKYANGGTLDPYGYSSDDGWDSDSSSDA